MNNKLGFLFLSVFLLNITFYPVTNAQKITKPDPIAPPELVAPLQDAQINVFPRKITFTWKQVTGAIKYDIEVDYNDGRWEIQTVSNTSELTCTVEFFGKFPGRWRVRSYAKSTGKAGVYSEWRQFTYLR